MVVNSFFMSLLVLVVPAIVAVVVFIKTGDVLIAIMAFIISLLFEGLFAAIWCAFYVVMGGK